MTASRHAHTVPAGDSEADRTLDLREAPLREIGLLRDFGVQSAGAALRAGGGNTAVLWVFRDHDDRWCVRKEGGDIDAAFRGREEALDFARRAGRGQGSYRLFFQLRDGRITQELFRLGNPRPIGF